MAVEFFYVDLISCQIVYDLAVFKKRNEKNAPHPL